MTIPEVQPITFRWRVVLLVAVIALAGWSRPAQAQTRWLQTLEAITPVRDGLVTRVLLDSLLTTIQYADVTIKRSPDDGASMSYTELEDLLLNDGYDFTSATHLFIGYRLEAGQRRFTSDITHLYFIYRPPEMDGIDVPILYLVGTEAEIKRVLEYSGTTVQVNQAAFQPFQEQLTFHRLPESTLVSVGGRVFREEKDAEAEKERLLATIRRFVYN